MTEKKLQKASVQIELQPKLTGCRLQQIANFIKIHALL